MKQVFDQGIQGIQAFGFDAHVLFSLLIGACDCAASILTRSNIAAYRRDHRIIKLRYAQGRIAWSDDPASG